MSVRRRYGPCSPNFFRDFDRPVPCAEAARMAVRALTEVLEIPHPGNLMYKAFDRKQRTILVPTLGLKRKKPAPPPAKPCEDTVEETQKLVLKAIREGSGKADLEAEEVIVDGVRARVATPRMLYRMKKDTVRPLDPENLRIACGLSSLELLAPVRRTPGVRKFCSVEEMSRARDRQDRAQTPITCKR